MDVATMNKLLSVGVQNGASDIHFRPGDPPMYRVNGTLRGLKTEKLLAAHTRQIALNLIREPEVREKIDSLQEYDTSYGLEGVSRFRVNLYRQRGSLAAVLRIIPNDVPSCDGLGLPPVFMRCGICQSSEASYSVPFVSIEARCHRRALSIAFIRCLGGISSVGASLVHHKGAAPSC